jgi:hypothetical protein
MKYGEAFESNIIPFDSLLLTSIKDDEMFHVHEFSKRASPPHYYTCDTPLPFRKNPCHVYIYL